MKWFLQLRLILWKNFLLRKRQKIRCLAEFLWPLFLFLILMWVRTRGLKSYIHECHFMEKAMPSTGSLPFLQSFICSFNNTCHRTLNDTKVHPISMQPQDLMKLLDDMQNIMHGKDVDGDSELQSIDLGIRQNTVQTILNIGQILRNLTDDGQVITYSYKEKDGGESNTVSKMLDWGPKQLHDKNPSILESVLNSNTIRQFEMRLVLNTPRTELCDFADAFSFTNYNQYKSVKFLTTICNLPDSDYNVLLTILKERAENNQSDFNASNSEVYRQLIQSFNKLSSLSKRFNESQSNNSTGNSVMSPATNKKIREMLLLFHRFFCGNDTKDILSQMSSAAGQSTAFDSLHDQFKEKITIIYHYDNTTTPNCNKIMKFIQKVPPLRSFWDIVKPFIMGKIVFTPVTNATLTLMGRVNQTFDSIRKLKVFFENAQPHTNGLMQEELFKESLSLAQDFIDRLVSNTTVTSDDNTLLNFFRKQLNMFNTTDNIEETTTASNEDDDDDDPLSITSIFECFDTEKVDGINDLTEARTVATELLLHNKLWALVEFHDAGVDELSPLVKYSIRMNTDKVDDTNYIKDRIESPGPRMRPAIDLKYLTYGFAYLQDLIDHSIISIHSLGDESQPGILFQQFPYPCYIIDRFIHAVSRTFPLFMVLSWVYTCSMIVKAVVYEKEQRLKETMRVMGLSNGIHWVGWLIDSLIPMLITNICLTLILVYGKVLTYSDPILLFVFLTAYSLATVSQSFLISVFFSRANLAAACAGTIFFILYLPYTFILRWMNQLFPYQKALLSLSSNVALGVGSSYFAFYEERGIGANWQNVGHSPVYGDQFNLSYVIYLLVFDFFLYLLLTIYIEAVFPGQYGIAKPWYFPLTLSYWTGRQPRRVFVKPRNSIAADNGAYEDNFEEEPVGLKLGVSIANLTKIYSNGKKAVNNISLNFYQDHITSFLGHNGAGKTTTISILTGLYNPTDGTASINGLDIRTDMDKIRNSLGMCPQYNVLFNRLTVEEHLLFYGSLRAGFTYSEESVREEIENMLTDLDLLKKRHSLPKDLSGGMQRKLSIMVAFIGGSKTVILDEPTSGVDPYSRRSIWELLVKYKKGRTIILTTHFMDEADLLGDRIAIIANGKLQCCGSGVFLKSRLGDGYRLTLDMTKYSNILVPQLNGNMNYNDYIEDPNVSAVVKQVREIIGNAQFVEQIGAEATIVLPRSNDIQTIISLLNYIEKNLNDLNVSSYGISDTSLEEIFLRVAEQGDPAIREMARSSKAEMTMFSKLYRYLLLTKSPKSFDMTHPIEKPMIQDTTVPVADGVTYEKEQPSKYWRQFWALHIKRFHHTKRNRKALFSELVLPAVFVCMSLIVCSLFPPLHERPSIQITPFLYPQPRYMFYATNLSEENNMKPYVDSINGPIGIGTFCMDINGSRNEECVNPSYKGNHGSGSIFYKTINWTQCTCCTGAQVCPDNIGEPEPSSNTIASGDTMFNMNDQNISNWIVNTWPKYVGQRYGGYTLGNNIPVPEVDILEIIKTVYNAQTNNNRWSLLPLIKKLRDAKTSSNNIKVWFNNKGWASSVGYMSAINNVLLRDAVNPADSSKYGIITYNHPMNYTQNQLKIEMIRQGGLNLLLAISIIFSLSFIPASFTLYLIEDRVTNSKHLQLVSGVNRFIYWVQTFSWDFLAYLLSSFLCILIFLLFKEEAYVSKTNFPGLVLLFILYGWACIPLMYPISFLFNVPSSAFVSLSCANVFIGSITTITTFVLANFDDPELKAVDNIIKEVFLIFPHFCLGDGLIKLATQHLYTAAFISFDIKVIQNILAWDVIGKNLVCMLVEGFIFSLITLAVEFKFIPLPFWKSWKRKTNLAEYEPSFEEDDVRAERLRISRNQACGDTLVIKDLSKMYKGAQIPSVNKISVGVKQGECFGLLGLNGAGKTSTFKMLTGAITPTGGDATVKGRSIVNEIDSVRALLGYCPQFDALDSLLTPREHLLLYGRIKNIPSDRLNQAVDELLKKLSLGHYSDKLAGTLSGGNKRKLSTAIALLGNPSLIFLDEPTSGMDPKARRFLWTCIQDLVREGCCVVLTSHSMEECQALCTKLTIMVNGQFKCLGTSQHLKNKYGGGYSVVIRCSENNLPKVRNFVEETLENSKLIEAHYNQLRYQIASRNVSSIFEALEKARSNDLIIDYSLSQTTLEDVFMRFANEQSEVTKDDSNSKSSYLRNVLCCCSPDKRKAFKDDHCSGVKRIARSLSILTSANIDHSEKRPLLVSDLDDDEYGDGLINI